MSKELLKGTCKYYRLGSKGDRVKIVVDTPELADWIKKDIKDSVESHRIDAKKPVLTPQDFMRHRKIEIRLV